MNDKATCAPPYGVPPLRAELQTAHDELNASTDFLAYAVCHTHDDLAWEVNIRVGNIHMALDQCHADRDAAVAAGAAWLRERLEHEPTADEAAFQQLWEEHVQRKN